ncbi:MAG: cyclic nucleotide-binding domain-containing protein [Chitinophaga rupis]
MEKLFAILQSIGPMSPELISWLRKHLRRRHYKAGETILTIGQICRDICFIESGLIRIYHNGEKGQETNWLQKENEIFISINSFFSQTPSFESIQALEDCMVWSITHADLAEACRLFPEFNLHQDKIKTLYYEIKNKRDAQMKGLPPRERYLYFLTEEPEIMARTPVDPLASWLQMSSKTLFKIRKDLWNDRKKTPNQQ